MLVNVKYALERVLRLCGLKKLKEKQKEYALSTFINGSVVFVSILIGYGKSVIYEILPLVYDTSKKISLSSMQFIDLHCSH